MTQNSPSGWCITRHHETCTDFYLKQPYSLGCSCECHQEGSEEAPKKPAPRKRK